ncbi:hypothetical protein [Syntrophomonas wolfei]|jgi:hypothetical protein|uniref:hypothetical protein n=1 Tax=Syntrophomonas wolfei TaxID=863 RepID=UPI0002F70CAD|nr:hypothetical protein [Syntrophomonas wolfei]
MEKNTSNEGEVDRMATATMESRKLNCMDSIRELAKKAIKEKGLSEKEVRKTLGSKRYEK